MLRLPKTDGGRVYLQQKREAADRLAGGDRRTGALTDKQDTAAVELAVAEEGTVRHDRCRGLQAGIASQKAVPEYHRRGLDAHADNVIS